MSTDLVADSIIEAILLSPKYANISPALIRRVVEQACTKNAKKKDALKAAKSKLHQAAGAYWKRKANYAGWLDKIRTASSGDLAALQTACREVMQFHSSSAERLSILPEFYTTLFQHLPPISSILDLACGLNPLAIPFMPLADKTTYTAYDIYADQMTFLQLVFNLWEIDGQALQGDIFSTAYQQEYDLALLLKSLTCLGQIEKESSVKLLETIPARYIFVSYPTASLGGGKRGMRQTYAKAFNSLPLNPAWKITELEFETELGYLVDKE